MKYANILLAVQTEIWALEESKLVAMIDFLSYMADGQKFTAEEIEARIGKGAAQAVARQEGAVAILPLQGVIAHRMNLMTSISGGTSSEMFGRAFQAALRDDGVKAIVIDVNSPGGAVDGTDELSSMIYAARGTKPIVAHANSSANSAAYWIASAADELVVTPGFASIGNIGVRTSHDDLSKAMEMEGVSRTLISAGKYKDEGNPLGPLSEEGRAAIQSRVDKAYGRFVKAVARNRGVSMASVRDGFGPPWKRPSIGSVPRSTRRRSLPRRLRVPLPSRCSARSALSRFATSNSRRYGVESLRASRRGGVSHHDRLHLKRRYRRCIPPERPRSWLRWRRSLSAASCFCLPMLPP
jgi:signal peptide peptidase SppA